MILNWGGLFVYSNKAPCFRSFDGLYGLHLILEFLF